MIEKIFLLKILCLHHALSSVQSNVVQTSTGLVRGKVNYYEKMRYYSYEGIPFAEPPVGDLRFMPPVPISPWTYILNASAPGPVCPQTEFIHSRSEMDENCLFLNIYVPDTLSPDLLPVVFYIHGGYYIFGSGKSKLVFGPQLIVGTEMILVTINYRLGALGFLSLQNIHASGNAGLKDILLASKWVKRNIIRFGGNPHQICMYGIGTGGALGHYMLLTDQSADIFYSAIFISGSATNYRALQSNPIHNALKLARQLGIECNGYYTLERLKEVDAFDIVEAEDYIIRNDPRRAFSFINYFSPSVEKPSPIAFITRHPLDIIRTDGLIQKIPIIAGFNNHEGLEIFVALKDDPTIVEQLNANFELCIPPDIRYPPRSQARKDLATSIREFYFGGGNITIFNTQNYINLITDTAYAYGIDYWLKLYYNQKFSSDIYYYVFQFDGQLNWAKQLINITYPGACRGDEFGYVFVTNITENKLRTIDNKSRSVSQTILLYIKNFALYGDSTPPTQQGFQWLEMGPNGNHALFDDVVSNVYETPFKERLAFWYKEYAKYYEYERNNRLFG